MWVGSTSHFLISHLHGHLQSGNSEDISEVGLPIPVAEWTLRLYAKKKKKIMCQTKEFEESLKVFGQVNGVINLKHWLILEVDGQSGWERGKIC